MIKGPVPAKGSGREERKKKGGSMMAGQKNDSILGRIFKRYFVDAMGSMALGLFSSLIIGLIISQLAQFSPLSFLAPVTAVVGAELGQLLSKKTPVDIIITPFVTIVTGGLAGGFVGPYVQSFMYWLGDLVNEATTLQPLPMGIIVGIVVGMVLTLPISSAALCIMMNLSGLAAGAAAAGCCAQMIGFAVISFRENGVGGLLSQGLGTSMLQVPNIMRHPQIWIAPTVASGLCGAVSAALLGMTNNASGAGMGTSGLVGQFGALAAMGYSAKTFLLIALVHFVLPAIVALLMDRLLRRIGWVKEGYMKLDI